MTKIRNRKLSKSAPTADDESPSPDPVGDKVRSTKCFFAKIKNVASLLALCLCVYVYIYYKMQYRPQKAKNPDSMVTALDAPSAVSSFAQHDMARYWGTYRSGHYLGMKTRSENSVVSGLMWLTQFKKQGAVHGDPLRHKCNQDNQLKYGWKMHDGVNFGHQDIVEEGYTISTKVLKQNTGGNGGDWTWRIEATPTNGKMRQAVTFLVYFATDGDGDLRRKVGQGDRLDGIFGESAGLGKFRVKFANVSSKDSTFASYEDYLQSLTGIHDNAMRRIGGKYINIDGEQVPNYIFGDIPSQRALPPVPHRKHKIVAFLVTADLPASFEVAFQSESGDFEREEDLVGTAFDAAFARHEKNFEKTFQTNFNFGEKWSAEHQEFGMAALSNMIGGMAYFYGHSLVQEGETNIRQNWDGPLFTAVPSRSFFPRGFLWDEGFHQLLVSRFSPKISVDSICHWLDLLNEDGWIPREQILDDEARERVPEPFIVQKNDRANPPTLFLALDSLIDEGHIKDAQLEALYPRLVAWFNWFNSTQLGPIPSTYAWQGRHIGDQNLELNPKTLTSGLDDFPRASHPTNTEYHLDLRCWMALAAQVLGKISIRLGKSNYNYLQLETLLKDNELLNKLHWDSENAQYSDYGMHSHKVKLTPKKIKESNGHYKTIQVRKVLDNPREGFVPHTGYVQLFPFIMKIIDSDSVQLRETLKMIRDPTRLWTPYGLRSLAKSDPLYQTRNTEHDPPYWRGNIWINLNFLAVRALEYYSKEEGPYQKECADLFQTLRENLIRNVFDNYRKTGFIWENYSDADGKGQGCHPFTGWSALTVLLMT